MKKISRRTFLAASAMAGSGILPAGGIAAAFNQKVSRPHIFVTGEPAEGLLSVQELKENIRSGHCRKLWERIKNKAESYLSIDPYTPTSLFPGRSEEGAKHANPDWSVCNAAGQRILQTAITHMLTGDTRYKEASLTQMEALFDTKRWPQWIDKYHLRFGYPADLRTGMLSYDTALAFDWLYPSLSETERSFILEGLERQGIQPYLKSLEMDPWWLHENINWLTVIVGGLGIAGMALADAHPQSGKLVEFSLPYMKNYLSIYGPEGEFNESPAYANATKYPVAYFHAYRYMTKGGTSVLKKRPFPQTCYWGMYLTLPPGRVAAFGDAHVDAAPMPQYYAAVAAASEDPYLQWFYVKHAKQTDNPLQLVMFDPRIKPKSPQDTVPKGKIFPAGGGCVVSRTSWSAETAACIVYGKSGREANHEHNDAGQLCIDANGERLITDLGSPSSYPADFFEENRWKYYNASVRGHNVLMFGEDEQVNAANRAGNVRDFHFVSTGSYWKFDLTSAYRNASVRRTVIHMFPGIIAALDEAQCEKKERISLRWHTIMDSVPDSQGSFTVTTGKSILSARIVNLDYTEISYSLRHHEYKPPFDKGRLGDPLEQRHEPYVEAVLHESSVKLLSLFAVCPVQKEISGWKEFSDNWRILADKILYSINIEDNTLFIRNEISGEKLGLRTG